ncbi:uncharacterized protein JCM15063_000804 [Sporobolomyces koalae]|uniref:uncharacterized protein n=1 Tax=Sporobolomyces koalae TaxID=500713 RepID=UPI00317F4A96
MSPPDASPLYKARRPSQIPLLTGEPLSHGRCQSRWFKLLVATTLTICAVSYSRHLGIVLGYEATKFDSVCEARGLFTPLAPEDEQRRLAIRIEPESLDHDVALTPENTILSDSFHPELSRANILAMFDNSSQPARLDPVELTEPCLTPSTHTLPLVSKPRITRNSPHVFFAISTTPERAVTFAPVWKHFMSSIRVSNDKSRAPGCIVTDAQGGGTGAETTRANALFRQQGLACKMQTSSKVGQRYEMRVLGLIRDAWIESERTRFEHPDSNLVEWFVFQDDDTWWSDIGMLRTMLSAYDSREDHYFGSFSETQGTLETFGKIGFGGAGVVLSRGLVRKMQSTLDRCAERFSDVFGGDGIMSHCAAFTRDIPLESLVEEVPSMRQMDIRGDATGYLTSGRTPFMTLHHWTSWLTLIPGREPIAAITLFSRAASILGGPNFLRRFVFDSGAVEVVLGYAVTLYHQPLRDEDLGAAEHSWDAHEPYLPARPKIKEGSEKLVYYISSIDRLSPSLAIFHHTCNDPALSATSLKTFSVLYDLRSLEAGLSDYPLMEEGPARASLRSSFDRQQWEQARKRPRIFQS